MQVGKIEFDDYNPNSIKVKMNFAMNLSDLGHNKGKWIGLRFWGTGHFIVSLAFSDFAI